MLPKRSSFRKTDRRQTPPAPQPDWRLSFWLPSSLAFSVAPGPAGPGVIVHDKGRVEIVGREREPVLREAAEWLDGVAGALELVVTATLTRGDEPGPTMSGPIRRGFRVSHEFVIVRGPAVIVAGPLDKPLIVASRRKR
jgi:hypothetical protein